jgi:uncharacterized protein DUF5666
MCYVTSSMVARIAGYAAVSLSLCAGGSSFAYAAAPQAAAPSTSQTQSAVRPVGTIKAISGSTITLTTDSGNEVAILVEDAARLVRIAPGQTNLKDAAPITLAELQTGDRILVRGTVAPDGKSVMASSVIAMKKADIADKQAREREEWQKHGIGGIVSSVDAPNNSIMISLPVIGEKKTLTLHVSNTTILRRYAPDSIKFDDAKLAPLSEIKASDQLRARGARSSDGSEFTAEEIVSGTFRNIAGIISAIDASNSSLTVQDVATKKPVTIKITGESRLRKLPPSMAQRIAARLKGVSSDAATPPTSAAAASSNAPQAASQPAKASGAPGNGSSQGTGGFGGSGRPAGTGAPDLQQAINRMPAATLAELQKGDAVMIVATAGGPDGVPTVITLLGGVEPILEASPNSSASTILSPWSLGAAPGGEATAQ